MINPFFDAAPDFVLRMFATDCVERLLWRERMRGCEPDPSAWDALKCMRKVTEDGPDDAVQHKHASALFPSYQETSGKARALRRAAWGMTVSDPKHAAKVCAQSLQSYGPASEQSWVLARLTWLITTHQWAGDRMGFLIPHGEIDTPEPMKIRA